jgi:hypothetical protein
LRLGVATERGLLRTTRHNVETSVVPRTATAALKSTSGPGAPSVATRQFCGSMASIQARFNWRRVSTSRIHRRKKTKGEKRLEWPGGAHGGAAVYTWPALWRGVRRRGRCSCRWSSSSALAPRSRVLVPSWFTSSFLWRGAASSPSPSLPVQTKVTKRRKPQWVGGLAFAIRLPGTLLK